MPPPPRPRPPRDRRAAAVDQEVLRVLLVEDSRLDATLVRGDLSPGPYGSFEVVETRSLAGATAAAQAKRFDAAVLDLGLPDGEGLEAYRRLAAAAPEMPIVVLTAADESAQAVSALRAGAEDYLVKGDAGSGLLARTVRHAVERRRARAAAARAESQLAGLFAHSPMPMEAYDPDGNLVRLNEAARLTFGIAEDEPRYNLFDSPYVMPAMKESLRRGEPFATEIVFQPGKSAFETTKDRPVWTDARVFPTFGSDGGQTGFFAVYEDITDRKSTEEALRRSEVMHRHLLSSVRDPVLALDRDMRVLYCNQAYGEYVGAAPELLEGTVLLEAFPEYEGSPSHRAVLQVLETGERAETEGEHGDKVIRLRVYPTPWGVLNVADDVTERRRAEERLQRLSTHLLTAQEETARRIGREIHDELGASLTGLKMDVALLEEGLGPDAAARAQRMRSTIDRLVEAVRGVAADLRPPALDTLGLTAALEGLASRLAARGGPAPALELDQSLDSLAPDRAAAVYRIVQESLTNASRHAPGAAVAVRTRAEDGSALVEVEDDGPGFDQAEAQPGVGLSGLRERASFLGGTVEIASRPGAGTTVSVRFPLES